jgi:hypothetical protein
MSGVSSYVCVDVWLPLRWFRRDMVWLGLGVQAVFFGIPTILSVYKVDG